MIIFYFINFKYLQNISMMVLKYFILPALVYIELDSKCSSHWTQWQFFFSFGEFSFVNCVPWSWPCWLLTAKGSRNLGLCLIWVTVIECALNISLSDLVSHKETTWNSYYFFLLVLPIECLMLPSLLSPKLSQIHPNLALKFFLLQKFLNGLDISIAHFFQVPLLDSF